MPKIFKSVLDFLLFSNIFIALCAAAQTGLTYQLFGLKPDLRINMLVFSATLSLYNFSIILSKPAQPEHSPFRRVRWIFRNQHLMVSLTLAGLTGMAALSLFLSLPALVLLLFLGLFALAYNVPFVQVGHTKIGLRNLPGIKLFLIAGIWSLSVVLLPLLQAQVHVGEHVLLAIVQRFLFIAAITIPFDIRDLYQDKLHELKTLPVLLGTKNAYLICQLALVASFGLSLFLVEPLSGMFTALLASTLLTAWLIFRSKWEKNEYYYFFYLDGTLILPWIGIELIRLAA